MQLASPWRQPKIILITSRDAAREKGVALMSGAEEILQKPFEMAELPDLVFERQEKIGFRALQGRNQTEKKDRKN